MVVLEQMVLMVPKEVPEEVAQKETEEHLGFLDNQEELDNPVHQEKREEP